MDERLPELSPDSQSLLAAGRVPERPSTEAAARVWGHLARAAPLPPVPPPRPPAPRVGNAAMFKLAALKPLAVGLGLFGAGVGTGVGGAVVARHLKQPNRAELPPLLAGQAPPVIDPGQPRPALAEAGEGEETAGAPPAQAPPPLPAHPRALPRRAAAPPIEPPAVSPSDAALTAERSLIARARSALQRSAPNDALAVLQSHELQFPTGRLAEEREALRIQALIAEGDRAAAERAAAGFALSHPRSLMGPAIQAALSEELSQNHR